VTTRRRATVIAAVVVVLAASTVGAVAVTRGDYFGGTEAVPSDPRPSPAAAAPFATLSPDAPTPTSAGLAEALAPALANPDLGLLTGRVADATTGDVLWQQNPDLPQTPGSVTKVLTAAAALLALSPAHRVATTVVPGSVPGQVVLVGGGDPTLTAQPAGETGYYVDAPRLDDLAEQVLASGVPAQSIVVDTALFPGPTMARGWNPVDIEGGSIAPIEPVMLDGGRRQPLVTYSPRTATPALDTGRALADRLGVDPSAVTAGQAPPGASPVATVWSAPLSVRLHQMMVLSDDVTAETIAREVALARGKPATFDGAVEAVTDVLAEAGVDLDGLDLSDLSGLSTDDRIPARVVDDVVAAATGTGEQSEKLRAMVDDLAVGGGSGTLWDRFVAPSPGAGWVRAKTGTLDNVNALAGYVVDVDGRALTFALMSTGTMQDVAKPALDAVATALRLCGCR
jgi:D-alanyl-D-alanine carboxypeptidase/D-alanyl-D-alanine-endopeptidase (penicillin-binding protein 4)